MEVDCINGNTMWHDVEVKESGQLFDYETFRDYGKGKVPAGNKRIKYHII